MENATTEPAIKTGQLPPDFCPQTEQERLEAYAEVMRVSVLAGEQGAKASQILTDHTDVYPIADVLTAFTLTTSQLPAGIAEEAINLQLEDSGVIAIAWVDYATDGEITLHFTAATGGGLTKIQLHWQTLDNA